MRFVVAIAALLWATPLLAQGPHLEIELPAAERLTRQGPAVRVTGVFADPAMRDALDHGFTVGLHYSLERWSSGGIFNSVLASTAWSVEVSHDPLSKRYVVRRLDGAGKTTASARIASFEAMVAEVERSTRAPMSARPHRDRQYYTLRLRVRTLSANDLDEVNRWLRGELQPAVRGERNPGTAIGRGIRQLFARLLGAERDLETRSPTFRVAP